MLFHVEAQELFLESFGQGDCKPKDFEDSVIALGRVNNDLPWFCTNEEYDQGLYYAYMLGHLHAVRLGHSRNG